MLVELVIENYAVVEHLRVRFHAGLNLLTGETGSGKSILVDALGLLFGGRASGDVIRTGQQRARLSGIFDAPSRPGFRQFLEASGIEAEDGELLIEREILTNGKSRAFAASRPVTAALLRDLAPWLGDIHGQHEQQQLFSPEAQRGMLDSFAGLEDAVAEAGRVYLEWRECAVELEELSRREQEQLRLADLWSFQRKEIEAASPKPGEDTALENERRVLQNVTRLADTAQAAFMSLYDAPESAAAQIRIALRKLQDLCRIDDALSEVVELLKPADIAVEEASRVLRDYLGRLEADPVRLEHVESRMASIEKLKRKYGPGIEEVLAFLEDVRAKMELVETASERRAEIEKRGVELARAYESVAAKLSERRKDAARKLQKRVETELAALAMERAVFRIAIDAAEWSAEGFDAVTFLVSTNAGEEPRAIERVASGGEISRIALALKTCIAAQAKSSADVRTLVFDEVDAGVGGAAAEAVGRRLKKLSTASQVLCVTHQPQVAGFADHHYRVEKRESKGRTVASVEELTLEERTREIGRMLSGQKLTPEALRHAEQLIRLAAGD